MLAGSAASLPLPQGPLSPSSFARRPRFTLLPQPSGPSTLARRLRVQKAADDPPRARILIAWNDSEAALQLQRLLRELGYAVVGPAGSREEFERLMAPASVRRPIARPVDCALVHAGLPEAGAIADWLADETVPLVWLVPDRDAVLPAVHADVSILDRPFDRAALVAAIEEAQTRHAARRFYPVPPPQPVWPRVFPQL
jgi:hypothetical protein